MHAGVATLGWILAIVATATSAPQLIHLLKGEKVGIEPLTPVLASTTMVAWVIFTLGIKDWPAFASSVGPLLIWASIFSLLVLHKVPRYVSSMALGVTLVASLILIRVFHILPIPAFGVLAAIGSTIWALPQLVKVHRDRGRDISGVSFYAYLFLALENAGWIVYAITRGVPQYALAPMIQFPACLGIAVYAHKAKQAQKRALELKLP